MKMLPPSVIRVLAATMVAAAGLHAKTPNLSAQIEEIRALLEADEGDTAQAKTLKLELRRYPDMWQQMLENDQLADITRQRVGADLTAVPDVAAKIAELLQDVKAEGVRRDAAKLAKAEAMLDRVSETLKAARKAEELDALILALSKTKFSEYDNNRKLMAVTRDLQNALQIVTCWQEYLLAKETGNVSDMRNNLERITTQLGNTPIMERSFALRLLKSLAPRSEDGSDGSRPDARNAIETIQAKMAETGDSAAALAALKAIPRSQLSRSDDSYYIRAVQAVEDLRKLEPSMAEAEVFANIRNLMNSQSQARNALGRAIDQIALNAIMRSYGIEPSTVTNTSSRKLLETMAASACKEQNWPQLRKILNSIDNLGSGVYGMDSQNKTAVDLKIIALIELAAAAERREDLETAATAYLDAASIDGKYLQREVAYSKLAALKEKFPAKLAPILAKAEEQRQRAEAARAAAEIEARNQVMTARGMSGSLRREDLSALKPLVQEAVAEFLKEKRSAPANPPEGERKASPEPAEESE